MKGITEKISQLRSQTTKSIDGFFGLRPITDVDRVGADVLYLKGLTPEALYTSYHDLFEVMSFLYDKGARSWCDVGCGVGRTCLLWSWLTDSPAVGVELVPERLEEARAASRGFPLPQVSWIEADFASPARHIPDSDVYFIYLSTGPQLDALLSKLKRRARPAWVVVIESHGDLKPRLQWEGWWLAPTANRFSLHSHRHDPWVQVYRTRPDHPVLQLEEAWEGRKGLLPEELALHPSPLGYLLGKSFQRNWELVIEEQGEMWTMETLGLAWHTPASVQGVFPPRQVNLSSATVGLRRLPEEHPYQAWCEWRRNETALHYITRQGQEGKRVKMRKIILSPRPMLEFSDGQRIDCDQLFHLEEQQ